MQFLLVLRVKALKRILDETGAKIVISSTWRKSKSLGELKAIFAQYGISYDAVIDTTPNSRDGIRGAQIMTWLKVNGRNVEKYIVIDDEDFDIKEYTDRIVKTLGGLNSGLSESDASKYVAFYWGGLMIGRFMGAISLSKMKNLILKRVSMIGIPVVAFLVILYFNGLRFR